jgi:hypothetical protein
LSIDNLAASCLWDALLAKDSNHEMLSWFLVVMKFMEEMVRQLPVVAVLCAEDLAESCLWGVLPPVGNHPVQYHLIHGHKQVFSPSIMVYALHQIYCGFGLRIKVFSQWAVKELV